MTPVQLIEGLAYPLTRDNVDTDLILPGRFLKTIVRTGLGVAAFEALRMQPGNVFDDPRFSGAPILIAGDNFGCGSSREHAVWALMDIGVRAVIASSFGDIFSGNAFKNGLLTIILPPDQVRQTIDHAQSGGCFLIDLPMQTLTMADTQVTFEIDPFRKHCLTNGLDEIALTLQDTAMISAFEARRALDYPWLDLTSRQAKD